MTLDAELSKVDDDRHFRARLFRIGKNKPDLKTEADALSIVEALEGADWRVLKVKKQRKTRRPYPPYTTSTLQQDGANRLGWPAAKTMKIAQELYEGVDIPGEGNIGLITYMRTDSRHLSADAVSQVRSLIHQRYGEKYEKEEKYERGEKFEKVEDLEKGEEGRSWGILVGLLILLAGLISLAEEWFRYSWDELWPLMIIVFGVFIIWRGLRARRLSPRP